MSLIKHLQRLTVRLINIIRFNFRRQMNERAYFELHMNINQFILQKYRLPTCIIVASRHLKWLFNFHLQIIEISLIVVCFWVVTKIRIYNIEWRGSIQRIGIIFLSYLSLSPSICLYACPNWSVRFVNEFSNLFDEKPLGDRIKVALIRWNLLFFSFTSTEHQRNIPHLSSKAFQWNEMRQNLSWLLIT